MRRLEFSPEARRDLIELWEYIAADNPSAADRVVEAIDHAVQLLTDMPGIGHSRPDVDDLRFRFWPVYSYLIAYRYTDSNVTIVRIIHGARDIRRHLGE